MTPRTSLRCALSMSLVVLLSLACAMSSFAMDPVDVDRLTGNFAGVFPRSTTIQGWSGFPVIKSPADPQSLPFELPGQAVVEVGQARALYRDKPAGIIERVSAPYTVKEMAPWRAGGQLTQVWATDFDITVAEHLSAADLEYETPKNIPPNQVVRLGDWACWTNPPGRDEEGLFARQGMFTVYVKFSLHVGFLRENTRQSMRELTLYWARQILNRLGKQAPPAPKLEIIAGPEGNPNPVAPGGTVQCSVQARHDQGLALSYRWTATGGSFNNPRIQNPIWTAPAAGGATQYGITVNITAADGTTIGASFLEAIGAAPDLHIDPDWIVLSYAHNNTFMQIEPVADQQCVVAMVKNEHPTVTARDAFVQFSVGPTLGNGTHIGNPVPVGDLPPGQKKTISTTWDLQGQNIENQRLYAHAYCQNMGDTNPDNDFASIDIEGIYYAHNGKRAFSFVNDTFSFKNYGLEDRGIAGIVNQQAALLAGCLDRKQPKAPLVSDPFYMLSYMRYKEYMKSFNGLHIGGLCHGFVHAAKDFFERPNTRPVAKVVSAMTMQEAGATISIYHTTQMLRLGPSLLTGKRYLDTNYNVAGTLAAAEDALKNKRKCVYIALAGYEEKADGTEVGTWGHAVLGFKLIKIAGRDAVLYVYDPNRPAASPYVQGQRCMTQIIFAPGAFKIPANMSMIYNQTPYVNGTRSRMYGNGVGYMPWLRDLSPAEVKSTALAANSTIYAMSSWMRTNGLAGLVLRCPADAHFVDAQGRRTGVVGGKVVNEIPGAEVRTSGEVEIYFLPTSGQYQVVIEGTGQGQARLAALRGESDTRIGVTTFTDIPLRAGSRTVAMLAPGGRIVSLIANGTPLSPQLDGAIDQDDPAWGFTGAVAPPPQSTALTVTSPTDGANVPEQFNVTGTGVPGGSVFVTVIAEATLKATGQNATSSLLNGAEAKVGTDGRWTIAVNAGPVMRDQRVNLKRMKITVQTRANGNVVEQVDLVVGPWGASRPGTVTAGNRPPTAPVVTIGPAKPTAADGLFCKAQGSVDPDGDQIEYRYQWYRNGTLMADRIYAGLAASWTKAGQTWRCVVTPTDGKVAGPAGEATVTIAP